MATLPDQTALLEQYLLTRSPALREQLVLGSYPLVHYILGRMGMYPEMGMEYQDLLSQGLIGLIEAVDHFRPGAGARFSTYAAIRIRGRVLDYVRSQDWFSRKARQRIQLVKKAFNTLYNQKQSEPDSAEIAAYLGMDVQEVEQAMENASRVIMSLDSLVDQESEGESLLHETVADSKQASPAEVAEEDDLRTRLAGCISSLPQRQQLVLSLYYYEELTLKEIGQVLQISESRVSQIHSSAMLSLKTMLQNTEKTDAQLKMPGTDPAREVFG